MVGVLAPVLNLLVPEGHVLHLSDYAVGTDRKKSCAMPICALAIDLIWGYSGILSLGHGLFFALGGYVMGMYLMRQIGVDGNYKSELPDFMVFLDWKELPWHWSLSDSFAATLLLVVLVPGFVAFVFGVLCFPLADQGGLFLYHHASAHVRRLTAVLSETKLVLVGTTALPTSSASWTYPSRQRVCE